MRVPERITQDWIGGLDDAGLLAAESSLRQLFAAEEATHRRAVGRRYDLMRGPAELIGAWDRWSRVNAAARARKLNPRRALVTS